MNGEPVNRQVRVVSRAQGIPTADNFAIVDGHMPVAGDGQILVELLLAAVDLAMRGWLSSERNFLTVVDGEVMPARGVARIIESHCGDWSVGDLVYGWFGWQQFMAVNPSAIQFAPAEAWLGFYHLARPRKGETTLVSTAAGGVGSVVGQLAATARLRAVGLTGGAEKVALATGTFGYGAGIDYRAVPELAAAIAEACPTGIDIFLDNTAGQIADAVFPSLNIGGRVIQCGTASIDSWLPVPASPRRERDMLVKRLSWHGLVCSDHAAMFPQALAALKMLH